MINDKQSFFRRLYNWTVKKAEREDAEKSLAFITALEGIIFPIPPDPLLMAMVFARPKKWLRLALITITASVLGGIVGYFIGLGLFETVGDWILRTLHLHEEYLSLGARFEENTVTAVFIAALTPIPYKLVTLTAGAFRVNFGLFVLASIVGRSVRFIIVSYLASTLGKKYRDQIEKYIEIISIIIVAILILFLVLH